MHELKAKYKDAEDTSLAYLDEIEQLKHKLNSVSAQEDSRGQKEVGGGQR